MALAWSQITIADGMAFGAQSIEEVNFSESTDVSGSELAADEMTAVVQYTPESDAADAYRGTFPYGAAVEYEKMAAEGTAFWRRYYLTSFNRIGKSRWKITAQGPAGLLDGVAHRGGIYENRTFASVLEEIAGASGDIFTYQVAADLAAARVNGWLPIATARENLHQLLFATGAIMVHDQAAGGVLFQYPQRSSGSIDRARTFIGGTVEYPEEVTAVELVEHTYTMNAETADTLFDNTGDLTPAASTLVEFNGAHYALGVDTSVPESTLTIDAWGVNWAVVSGVGILRGYPYTDSARIVRKETGQSQGKVIRADGCTLISPLNSDGIAANLALRYAPEAIRIRCDFCADDGETPGLKKSVANPFIETKDESAYIESMETKITAIARAKASFLAGYTPGTPQYKHIRVFHGNGSFTLHASIARVRVVLISGGSGGSAGLRGGEGVRPDNGTGTRQGTLGTAGAGGAGGTAGSGGRILIVDDVVNPNGRLTVRFNTGAGGSGGAYDPSASEGAAGTAGSDTTASVDNGITTESYTTADAAAYTKETGYYDVINGIAYGADGAPGVSGGDGYEIIESVAQLGRDPVYTVKDPDGTLRRCGASGQDKELETRLYRYWFGGGGGGGAAVGFDGGIGGNAEVTSAGGAQNMSGSGGAGASAAAIFKTQHYGCGGSGGHGGGGAGKAGGNAFSASQNNIGWQGTPGDGTSGQPGADGCVLVYY